MRLSKLYREIGDAEVGVDVALSDREMTRVDSWFFEAVAACLKLYDLVDVDREIIRDEMAILQGRWSDTVGPELAVLDDAKAVEDALAGMFDCD